MTSKIKPTLVFPTYSASVGNDNKRIPLKQPEPKSINPPIQEKKPKYDLRRSEPPPDETWSFFVPVPEIKESSENKIEKEAEKETKLYLPHAFESVKFRYSKFGSFSQKKKIPKKDFEEPIKIPVFSPKKVTPELPTIKEKPTPNIQMEPLRVEVSIQPTKSTSRTLVFPVSQ
jgi:hypothetical protein